MGRSLNDWEVKEMERLLLRLQGRGIRDVGDTMMWVGTKEGIFSIKQLYKKLEPEIYKKKGVGA